MIMFLGRRDKVGQEPGWPHFVDAADCPAALAIYQNKDQVAAESAKYLANVSPGSTAVKGPTYLVEFDDEGSKPKRIGPHGLDAPAGQWIKKLVQILEGCWIPAIVSMEKG